MCSHGVQWQTHSGGYFTTAGGVSAKHIAAWNGSSWVPLGTGTDGSVRALTVYDGKLIAGGDFTTAGGVSANRIAAWDGSSWASLGSGTDGNVRALTVYGGKLIAGGDFTTAGTYRITSWDGISWASLGSGMNNWTGALTVYDGKLIAGGYFTTAGGVPAKHIAAWNGSSWASLGSGINERVGALAIYNNKLVAGGWIWTVSYNNNIEAWNGTSWWPLGSGSGMAGKLSIDVSALTVYDGKLIAGGIFRTADDVWVRNIAAWDGTSWAPLGTGIGNIIDDANVYALTVYDGNLIVGGGFTTAGTTAGSKVAPYITSWTKKDSPNEVGQLSIPSTVQISPNFPNPFNPSTTIEFTIPADSRVVVKIYNLTGQEVATLQNKFMSAGRHSVIWEAKGMPSGLYFYSVKAGNATETRKMILLK